MCEVQPNFALIRVDGLVGDDLEDVRYFQIDAAIESELRRFIQTGECEPRLSEQLMALVPETIPAYPSAPPKEIYRSGREYLCALYVSKFGRPIQETLRLTRQYK